LVGNVTGFDFWKAVGFKEYCITLEMENQQKIVDEFHKGLIW